MDHWLAVCFCSQLSYGSRSLPIIPLRQLRGRIPIAIQTANLCARTPAYVYLLMLLLFFQIVLLDSATKATTRLAIPSLATTIGDVIVGGTMPSWGKHHSLLRLGAALIALGTGLMGSFGFYDSKWKYIVFIFPANLGQAINYPAKRFTTLACFDHFGFAVSYVDKVTETGQIMPYRHPPCTSFLCGAACGV